MINSSLITKVSKESRLPVFFSLFFLSLLAILYFLFPGMRDFFIEAWVVLTSDDEQRIMIWVQNFSWFGPLLLILIMIFQMFLVFIPTLVLIVVCILAYGPVYGGIIALVAIFSASSVGYGIGRYLGPGLAERLIGKSSIKKGSDFLLHYGFWAVFITRINPFLSNDAVSLISGILKMNYWQFVLASITGIAPLIILIAIFGETTEVLKTGLLWISLVSLIIFLIYLFWNKVKQSQKKV